jgi:hypothetical protein
VREPGRPEEASARMARLSPAGFNEASGSASAQGGLRVQRAVVRLFFYPDQEDPRENPGSRCLGFPGLLVFDVACLGSASPFASLTIAANDRQTCEGDSMNRWGKRRFRVITAAGSVVWALSAGLPTAAGALGGLRAHSVAVGASGSRG